MAEYVAAGIIEILLSDLCINIIINIVNECRSRLISAEKLLPYAKMMNAQFVDIFVYYVLDATLAYSLNHLGVPTLVTEMGVGNRITPKYCRDIVDGIFNLMSHMGIWDDEPKDVNDPIISTEGEVTFLTAKESGIFVSAVDSMGRIGIGTHIGDIIEPIEGRIIQRIESPTDGIIFTLRENPVVHKGALIARVYGGR
ncbi:MAG: succinylglutamate desuccinylase/aspartoacylase family protein [Lachnospira eligens]